MRILTGLHKIKEARMLLTREFPFYGSVFWRMNITVDNTCPTAWTDGRSIGYNEEWLGQWSILEILGVFVHEVLHVILKHHLREELNPIFKEKHGKFNRACDYALNPIIVGTVGMELPKGCLLDLAKWPDSLVEHIFAQMPDDPADDGPGGGDGEGGSGGGDGNLIGEVRPLPGKDGKGKASKAELDQAANEVDQWVNAAGMKATQAGRFGDNQRTLLKKVQNPGVRWEDEIQFMVEDVCRSDYTWARPNPRYIQAGVYLPSMHGRKYIDMIFFVDSSGSLCERQLEQMMAEIRAIIEHFHIRVIVVYWDTGFKAVEIFDESDVLSPDWGLHVKGGGGTDFRGVLDWMDESLPDLDVDPKAVIFFTDMECRNYPADREPDLPWIWAHVPSGSNFETSYLKFKPDWGRYIKIPIFKGVG